MFLSRLTVKGAAKRQELIAASHSSRKDLELREAILAQEIAKLKEIEATLKGQKVFLKRASNCVDALAQAEEPERSAKETFDKAWNGTPRLEDGCY